MIICGVESHCFSSENFGTDYSKIKAEHKEKCWKGRKLERSKLPVSKTRNGS